MTTRLIHESSFGRRLLLGAGIVLAVLLAAHLIWGVVAQRRLSRVETRLETDWGPLTPLSLAPPPVPEAANAAKAWRAAAELVALDENQARLLTRESRHASEAPSEQLLALLEANRLPLMLAHEAAGRAGANWQLRYRDGAQMQLPNLLQLMRLHDLLGLELRRELAQTGIAVSADASERALERGLQQLALADSLAQEPLLILQQMRLALESRALSQLLSWLKTGTLERGLLERARRQLADQPEHDALVQGLLGELKTLTAILGSGRRAEEPRGLTPAVLEWLARPLHRSELRLALTRYDAALQLAALPASQRRAEQLRSLSELEGWHPVASQLLVDFEQLFARRDVVVSSRRMLQLAVALEAHRLDGGELPTELADLAVDVPSDPLSEEPFRYQRLAAGYQLESLAHRMQLELPGRLDAPTRIVVEDANEPDFSP